MKRILLAAAIAGIALFAWESVAHMLTPLGMAGFRSLSNEKTTLEAMKAQIPDSGLYFFPLPKELGGSPEPGSPTGLLMFQRHAALEMTPAQLLIQLAVDIGAMFLAAFILSQAAPQASAGMQFLLVLLMSLFSGLRGEIPLWNWFGFPRRYVAAQITITVVGFAIAGLILPRMLRPRAKSRAAAAPA